MTTDTRSVADALEAETRKAMARVRPTRGWDTGRERADDLAWVDELLDRWLEVAG